jgi:acetylglutamate kinase
LLSLLTVHPSWLIAAIDWALLVQIAAALQAEKLILMTDVPGVLRDKNDVATKFATLNIRECRQLTDEGIIAGETRLACLRAAAAFLPAAAGCC